MIALPFRKRAPAALAREHPRSDRIEESRDAAPRLRQRQRDVVHRKSVRKGRRCPSSGSSRTAILRRTLYDRRPLRTIRVRGKCARTVSDYTLGMRGPLRHRSKFRP